MRVKFRVQVSDGLGGRYASGQVADIDEAQARAWLGLGFVEPVQTQKRTAVKRAPRRASKRKG